MTLRELLNVLDPDETVFIGARTNYIFVGKPKEFLKDAESYDEDYLKQLRKLISNRIDELNSVESDTKLPPEQREYMINSLNRRIERWRRAMKNRIPFLDRPIIDQYEKTYEEGLAIIIKGTETGDYWTQDEFENKKGAY